MSRGHEGPLLTRLPGLVVGGGADLLVPNELETALGVLGEESLHVLEGVRIDELGPVLHVHGGLRDPLRRARRRRELLGALGDLELDERALGLVERAGELLQQGVV
eukprot:10711288-Alexandrium_andersonii.AAC.1